MDTPLSQAPAPVKERLTRLDRVGMSLMLITLLTLAIPASGNWVIGRVRRFSKAVSRSVYSGGQCTVDAINGRAPDLASETDLRDSPLFVVSGWAFDRASQTVPKHIFVQLKHDDVVFFEKEAWRVQRSDVAAAFSQPNYRDSGVLLEGSTHGISPGHYTLHFVQRRGSDISCDGAVRVQI